MGGQGAGVAGRGLISHKSATIKSGVHWPSVLICQPFLSRTCTAACLGAPFLVETVAGLGVRKTGRKWARGPAGFFFWPSFCWLSEVLRCGIMLLQQKSWVCDCRSVVLQLTIMSLLPGIPLSAKDGICSLEVRGLWYWLRGPLLRGI